MVQSPLIVDLGFAAFVIYATVPGIPAEQLLRPGVPLPHAVLLRRASVRAAPLKPALWHRSCRRVVAALCRASLPFLLLFRLTCYYYRGAYYRLGVAVAGPHAPSPSRTPVTPARPGFR